MISTALKSLAAHYQLSMNNGMVYGYLMGSYVTLTENLLSRRMSIYVGCVDVPHTEDDRLSPAAKCSSLIVDMVTKASGDSNIYALLRNRWMPALTVNHSGSVVTLNFRKDTAGINSLHSFIAEFLPRITPLTAPLQCACCGGHTQSQGYPVRIAADTVVPMHIHCFAKATEHRKSALPHGASIIGASVGALLGAFIWSLLSHAGYISALGTLFILALTLGSYILLGGKRGKRQHIVLAVCMTAAILLGTVGEYLWTMHEQYIAYGSVVNSLMKESVYMRVVLKDFFTDGTTLGKLLLNLAIALVFVLIEAFCLRSKSKGCAPAETPTAMPGQA